MAPTTPPTGIGEALAIAPPADEAAKMAGITLKWDDTNCGTKQSPIRQGGCWYSTNPSVIYLSTGMNTADRNALLDFEIDVAVKGVAGEFKDGGCVYFAYSADEEHGYMPNVHTC